jgi:hypothetical protein
VSDIGLRIEFQTVVCTVSSVTTLGHRTKAARSEERNVAPSLLMSSAICSKGHSLCFDVF